MQRASPVLRAVKKLPFSHIQYPNFDLPRNLTWGATQPLKSGYEKFYAESIRSVLCVPSHWHTFESDLKVARSLFSSKENPLQRGYFNTGATFTLFDNPDYRQLEFIADSIRQTTIKEIGTKIGGSTDWLKYGDNMLVCSLRYSAKLPEMKIANSSEVAKAEEMLFIQDLVLDKSKKVVFLMKFETPKTNFTKEMESTFEVMKTSSYFVINTQSNGDVKHENDDDEKQNGFVFLQL
jgi:hypothetical protein